MTLTLTEDDIRPAPHLDRPRSGLLATIERITDAALAETGGAQ